jgi:hypothetical protein
MSSPGSKILIRTIQVSSKKINDIGYITKSQFARGIPPSLVDPEEEDVLLSQYCHNVTGTVNYFKLNNDVNRRAAGNMDG